MRLAARPSVPTWSPSPPFLRKRRARNRRTDAIELLQELALLETVREVVSRYDAPSPGDWADTARSAVGGMSLAELGARAAELSIRSTNSWVSILSARSLASLLSFGSVLSVGSAGSLASVGSALSIGSSGSVLSIGSSGSVLSIGASGGFCTTGARQARAAEEASEGSGGVDAATVRRISGFLAVAAMIAAPFDRRRVA